MIAEICAIREKNIFAFYSKRIENILDANLFWQSTARMVSDKKDREALKIKLAVCIHPLNPEVHPEQLVNVANGTIGASEINVDQAVRIGHSQMLDFEKALPTGFWTCIERKI